MRLIKKILYLILLGSINIVAHAEVFVINRIKVVGLERIDIGTVLNYLPVKEGDRIDSEQTSNIIRVLYQKTNFFSDITLERKDNDLIIHVVERPIISFINTSGNHKISKQNLLDALKGVGIVEGQALDPAILHAMQKVIIQRYNSLGMYDPKVNIEAKSLARNRVRLNIQIQEGPVAKIKLLKIVGNKTFKEKTLLNEFALTTSKPWNFLTSSDQYSKEKLEVDIEKLRSYYMDRGFVRVHIDEPKVTITPDKKSIHVVITLAEGACYKITGVKIQGEMPSKQEELRKLIPCKIGTVFSRKDVVAGQTNISEYLGNLGYGRPEVRYDIAVNDKLHEIQLLYVVIPGQLVYIRHIDFNGNTKTRDEVLRREMRLQEGGLFSFEKISESRRRLANLGYFQDVNPKFSPIVETNNQVDLLYDVKEISSINFNMRAGYSDSEGFIYAADLQDSNFRGTGKTVTMGFNNGRASQYYGFGYHNPYFTQDKIGFSVNGYLRKFNPNRVSGELSAYETSTRGLLFGFDLPLSDYTQLDFGIGIESIFLGKAFNPNTYGEEFINKYGQSFSQLKTSAGWQYSNLDRAIFPTSGFRQVLSGSFYAPLNGHSLTFYKLNHTTGWYLPLFKDFIFHSHTILAYGNSFMKDYRLPPFANFYCGGMDSVRGFDADSLTNNESNQHAVIGGNILTVAQLELIVPNPMQETVRTSIIYDVGGIYDGSFKPSDLRMAYGIQVEWRIPLIPVPLKFSFAKPLRKKGWDHIGAFQMSIGFSMF